MEALRARSEICEKQCQAWITRTDEEGSSEETQPWNAKCCAVRRNHRLQTRIVGHSTLTCVLLSSQKGLPFLSDVLDISSKFLCSMNDFV